MTKQRADLGFTDNLEEFDPAEWTPAKPRAANDRVETAQAAEAAGFKSREPRSPPAQPASRVGQGAPRRRRTGRNAQFNLKTTLEAIAAFTAIADRLDWGLGETFEKAIPLLEREYLSQGEK